MVGDAVQITDTLPSSREPSIGLSPRGEPRVVWSDLEGANAEVYLKVATLPYEGIDLGVYASDISFVPPTVIADEETEVHIQVHNHGDMDAGRSDMNILFDFGLLGLVDLPPIPAGGTYEYVGHVTMVEGEHWVRVELDPDDEIAETVEHNNEATRSVRAYPPGTLEADAGPDTLTSVGRTTYLDATSTVYNGDGLLSYEWDMGDGSAPVHGLYVEHVFLTAGTFTTTLTVSDGTVEDSDTCQVLVRERDDPPDAVIDPTDHIVADRLDPVTLSAEGSTDDNGVEGFMWDLGDGSSADTAVVSHQYTSLGTYIVTLTVTDVMGQFDINKTTVEVVNLPPTVGTVTGPDRVDTGDRATFTVVASDPDGEVESYGWDFDARDGITFEATGSQARHAFDKAGTYNVTCIVRDDDGGQTLHHVTVRVEDNYRGPVPAPGPALAMTAISLAAAMSVAFRRRSEGKKPYQSANKTDLGNTVEGGRDG
jgi:PKD repeat protein